MEKSFEFLLQMLSPDNVFIPKALLARKDIGDDAKLLFSEIFTENRFGTIEELKSALKDMPNDLIEAYAQKNSPKKLKSDLSKIYDSLEEILLISVEEGA